MKNNAINFLSQPYPFYYEGKSLHIILSLLFSMTFFFNYFFEPFNIDHAEHKMNFFWITFIHALTPTFIAGIFALIIKKTSIEQCWNIKKEVLFIFLFFLCVGIVQFLIRDLIYDNANNWSMHYLYEEIRNTLLVGSLFVIILIPLNFNMLNIKNIHSANNLNSTIDKTPTSNLDYDDKAILKINDLQLDINHFIFAKAEGNYVEVYLERQQTNKVLIRITLKKLESFLKPYPNIIKTHRSYLINIHFIKKVNGNAQGYKLQLKNHDTIIPVARNIIALFDNSMNAI